MNSNEIKKIINMIDLKMDEIDNKLKKITDSTPYFDKIHDLHDQIKSLQDINEALSNKCEETEEYYIEKIRQHKLKTCENCKMLEFKYLNILEKINELKQEIEILKIKIKVSK
ncbi:hypothetical protein TCON_1662 [Astathelohania contejeani]|uniref:Uncharacterized protein n=1 Tax=Astathelohania contejeani TaxID=164912 RepID=A0ABQ7HY65_9MICR|nr:hypothetical protein TCON_1662 [Thelohania contejeani]